MSNYRYIMLLHGPNAADLLERNKALFTGTEHVIAEDSTRIISSDLYPAGLPNRVIWQDNLGLIMHGIAFPKHAGIDELAEDPDRVLGEILKQYKDDPTKIPYAFLNGSFVGIVLDKANKKIIAFTSFLNSLPLYYAWEKETLIISTSYMMIAKMIGKSLDHTSMGMIEYYQLGTNLSEFTPIDSIKTVAKGAYIECSGNRITHDFYYVMPAREEDRSFNGWVDEFAALWDTSTNGLHSKTFNYGLGFTGGIDSRLILAGIKNKEELLYFTGSHKDHLDYILAQKIASDMGLSSHHVLEDYSQSDYLKGYVDYLAISDNPIYNNKVYNIDQLKFRRDHHLTFELTGLTEYLGGVYHYTDRRKISNTINMSLPLKLHALTKPSPDDFVQLAHMGLRNTTLDDFQAQLSPAQNQDYKIMMSSSIAFLNRQINNTSTMENYLERFRHIHKMANLLEWNRINGRSYVELLSPSMNIEMTDFAAKIPLHFRDNRRILLGYLKKYHPQLSKIVLSGYIFSPNSPWLLYKMLSPYIKVLNHLGYKVPFLQWYINSNSSRSFVDQRKVRKLQMQIALDSKLIQDFMPGLDADNVSSIKLMRLFNLALLDRRLSTDDQNYQSYLMESYLKIK